MVSRATGIERRIERMTQIVVTGGSGKAGRAVVRDLVEHGYEVVNVDVVPATPQVAPFLRADLTDYGETVEALRGADAVVHLAAIPAPRIRTVEQTFEINILSTYNVFSAAALLGLERVVWASSETVLGLPFGGRHGRSLLDPAAAPGHHPEPDYVPIDEEHPLRPHSSYSLSKVLGEEMARQFARWSHIPFVGLRFSAIREPADYESFPDTWRDPHLGEWNVWGYVDARDVGQACRLALSAEIAGAEVFIIAAGDTVMDRPNSEIMGEYFPSVEVRPGTGDFDTLLSIDRARRVLGYAPGYTWRDMVARPMAAGSRNEDGS
jgi:nucleoside-diphosphate-sugar epimerase